MIEAKQLYQNRFKTATVILTELVMAALATALVVTLVAMPWPSGNRQWGVFDFVLIYEHSPFHNPHSQRETDR
jgi:hypothetical protein